VLKIDPPDPNVTQIALPQTPSSPGGNPCKLGTHKRISGKNCSKLKAAVTAYSQAVLHVGSLYEALAKTANRYSTAQASGDTEDTYLQRGVADTYLGLIAQALPAQAAAGKTLATVLRKLGLDVKITGSQLGKVKAKMLKLKGIPKSSMSTLALDGYSAADLKAALTAAFSLLGHKTLDLQKTLATLPPRKEFVQQYETVEFGILAQMVKVLTAQGLVTSTGNFTLNDDLQNAQLACGVTQRLAAVQQFITDAGTMIGGGYASFVQFAGDPLLTYHPPASNVPPTAAFTPSSSSGSISAFTNTISFTDGSSDPDGGQIVCHAWDFGDPSSGANDTSALASPQHTYANPGTYTVTETVTDDDGFGNGTVSQQIVISP
jgi:PKD domain